MKRDSQLRTILLRQLTYWSLAWWIWVNKGSDSGLSPDSTKSLPEPMLLYHQRLVAFTWRRLDFSGVIHQMWCCDLGSLTQIANFMGPTWGPPGSCRPQMGPMLAPWTLLSEHCYVWESYNICYMLFLNIMNETAFLKIIDTIYYSCHIKRNAVFQKGRVKTEN